MLTQGFRQLIEKVIIMIDHVKYNPTPLGDLTLEEIKLLRIAVRASFSNLTKQERQILVLRLGLKDGHPRSSSEAATELNIDSALVKQAEQSIFRFFHQKRQLNNPINF